jgi:eukaryotic-like serine/threonine-protein kinase
VDLIQYHNYAIIEIILEQLKFFKRKIFKHTMKTKKILFFLAILLSAGILSACTGAAFNSTSWAGITVNGDSAYVTYNQHVYAINLSNGTEKWRFPQEADNKITFYAAPEMSPDGQLIVGGYNHILYSLDPANGQLNWSFSQAKDRYIGGPLASEAGIFAPSADNNLYALDQNGNLLWIFPASEPLWAKPATDDTCECVFLTSMDHHVYAIDAQSGNQKWKSDDLDGAIVGTPAFSGEGRLFVGTFGNEMIALDTNTGRILWRFKTENWIWSGPTQGDQMVYFGDLSGNLYAINAADGTQQWKIKPNDKIVGIPMVIDDMIVFTTELDTVYAVDKGGNPLWSQAIGGRIYSSPVAAGDLILVAPIDSDALLVALATNGTQRWKFSPEQ